MSDSPQSILIAEDNRVMAGVVRFNLERAGYKVVVAVNGREAFEQTKQQRFDLIITDYQMPEMSGEELCQAVRTLPEYSSVPIMMCSAKGLELDRDTLKERYGVQKLLFKPFSPKELVQSATELLALTSSVATT